MNVSLIHEIRLENRIVRIKLEIDPLGTVIYSAAATNKLKLTQKRKKKAKVGPL